MDQVLVNKLHKRIKAEKILLEALIEFIGETSGEGNAPIDQEDAHYIKKQLDKVNAERKVNRRYFNQTLSKIIKI
jgi:hypothetical protein